MSKLEKLNLDKFQMDTKELNSVSGGANGELTKFSVTEPTSAPAGGSADTSTCSWECCCDPAGTTVPKTR